MLEPLEEQPRDVLEQQQAFDEERRSGIFSTDVAAILGLTRYGTPLSVYKSKVGEAEPRPISLPAWIGQRLEGMVAELYTAATGNRVRADNLAHYHPAYPWFGAHLDYRVVGDARLVVEMKTRNSTRGWGDDGSSDIPPDVWCQVQTQMEVVGAREAHVATLFSNSSFRVYKVLPEPTFIAELIPTLETFWFQNVQAHVPPLPTGSDRDTELVNAMGGGNSGKLKAATPEHEQLAGQYRLARLNAAQAEFARDEVENRIKTIIGEEYDGLTGAFGTIWWKRVRDWRKTDWKVLATVYRAVANDLLGQVKLEEGDGQAFDRFATAQLTLETAEGLYTETRPGTRRIRAEFREQ